jgi:hypothetical protein
VNHDQQQGGFKLLWPHLTLLGTIGTDSVLNHALVAAGAARTRRQAGRSGPRCRRVPAFVVPCSWRCRAPGAAGSPRHRAATRPLWPRRRATTRGQPRDRVGTCHDAMIRGRPRAPIWRRDSSRTFPSLAWRGPSPAGTDRGETPRFPRHVAGRDLAGHFLVKPRQASFSKGWSTNARRLAPTSDSETSPGTES